ncbi:MAG: tetratricopeptide repeat protein [Ignavibacteriae bacterium]|nr:tetratricopeptide repeat protein [Ignavibacteria bacterium]MBI3365135.1 tetratricopeptide repeat protein [Ignavibacteriota bacterium]
MQESEKGLPGAGLVEWRARWLEALLLIVSLSLFLYQCWSLWFIQDDSFITFRYVKNFTAGHGLVFNSGERVEGYTTFLWALLLALPAKLGIDVTSASQYLGILFGLGSLCLLYSVSRKLSTGEPAFPFALVAVILLAANGAFAYWSVSGMETAMFTFLTLLSAIVYLRERSVETLSVYTPIVFILLSLTRPEGALLFGLLMASLIWEIRSGQRSDPKRMLKRFVIWMLVYLLPMTAYAFWRLSYYGYLLPNTYYAKAGFSKEYLTTGFDYFWAFAKTYLFGGILLVAPVYVIIKRKWSGDTLPLFMMLIGYIVTIILVGGDVLPSYRFFVPVLPFLYLFTQESLRSLFDSMVKRKWRLASLLYVSPLLLAGFSFAIPHEYIHHYATRESQLVEKMAETGRWLKSHASPNDIVAASTIGALGYYSGLPLLDMLGLTDSVIAHRPEQILGVASNWRERNYNVRYVLSRRPDWICFSTGIKPSAFAERALFTSKDFRRWYYPFYFHASGDAGYVEVIYKRSAFPPQMPEASEQRPIDNDFVNRFTEGINLTGKDDERALQQLQQAAETGPADFALLFQSIANVYRSQHNIPKAIEYYSRAVAIDPRLIESHLMLAYEARRQNNLKGASLQLEEALRTNPDYSPAWVMLGQVYLSLADTNRARAAFEHAVEVAPLNPQARDLLQTIIAQKRPGIAED